MNTWITADLHLGESRFELMGRPFSTVEEHINTLRDNYNKLVAPDDIVYIVGDVCYQKTPEFLPRVAEMNGRKILFRGNHDRVFTDEELKPYFEEIIPEGEGQDIILYYKDSEGNEKPLPCYITHYPTCGIGHAFNLVGHIHGAWKYQLNMFNVGIDVNGYRPVNLNKIPFHFNAIKDFYDDDVWVGYNEINSAYIGKRGKQSRYFTAK